MRLHLLTTPAKTLGSMPSLSPSAKAFDNGDAVVCEWGDEVVCEWGMVVCEWGDEVVFVDCFIRVCLAVSW